MENRIRGNKTIGQNLRELRIAKGLTQKQVVAKFELHSLDISREIYSQMEMGTYSIKPLALKALTELYEVDYNRFFDGLEYSEADLKE